MVGLLRPAICRLGPTGMPLSAAFGIHALSQTERLPFNAMQQDAQPADDIHAPVEVDLKNAHVAALLAWLWPGAGHFYQGRYGKAVLFMVCIVSTYFFGLAMGNGKVVYAAFNAKHKRYAYICQLGVGLPSLGALAQAMAKDKTGKPLFGIPYMYPPTTFGDQAQEPDELSDWHHDYHGFFEMGTLYTMVAGLLNVLVIYDAFAGPMFPQPEVRDKGPPSRDRKSAGKRQD